MDMVYKLPFKDWMGLDSKVPPTPQPQEMPKEELISTATAAAASPKSEGGRTPSAP